MKSLNNLGKTGSDSFVAKIPLAVATAWTAYIGFGTGPKAAGVAAKLAFACAIDFAAFDITCAIAKPFSTTKRPADKAFDLPAN